jgi:hypothetical protein
MELRDALINDLYGNNENYFQKELNRIISENSQLHGNNQQYFQFRNEVYVNNMFKGAFERPTNMLHKEMRQSFKTLLADQEANNKERALVLGYIQRILATTTYAEDFLRVLPTSLHQIVFKYDRHFTEGDGILQGEALKEFQSTNQPLLKLLKGRMAYSLLEG